MADINALIQSWMVPEIALAGAFPLYAHLPVPSPDEDEEEETVRRHPGGGNIDPDDDDESDQDDDEDDDEEDGLVLAHRPASRRGRGWSKRCTS